MRRRREAPSAFGIAVVDLFSCAFVVVAVLAFIESPGAYPPLPPAPPGLQVLVQGGEVQIELELASGIVHSWEGTPSWLSASESVITAYPPAGESIRHLRVFAGPYVDAQLTPIQLVVAGKACLGAAGPASLDPKAGYRWEKPC